MGEILHLHSNHRIKNLSGKKLHIASARISGHASEQKPCATTNWCSEVSLQVSNSAPRNSKSSTSLKGIQKSIFLKENCMRLVLNITRHISIKDFIQYSIFV